MPRSRRRAPLVLMARKNASSSKSLPATLRLRLEILEPVRLSLIEANPLVVSVESIGTRSGPFVIRADQAFLQTLVAVFDEAEILLWSVSK